GGETWNYKYNNWNELVRVEKHATDGGTLQMAVDYVYDTFGERIRKDVDSNGDGTVDTTTKYAFDEKGNIWADLDSSGNITTRRLYADAVDAVFARIGSSGNEDWYLTDQLGSVRDIIDY